LLLILLKMSDALITGFNTGVLNSQLVRLSENIMELLRLMVVNVARPVKQEILSAINHLLKMTNKVVRFTIR